MLLGISDELLQLVGVLQLQFAYSCQVLQPLPVVERLLLLAHDPSSHFRVLPAQLIRPAFQFLRLNFEPTIIFFK